MPDRRRPPTPPSRPARRPRRALSPTVGLVLACGVVAGVLLAACGSSGRDMASPKAGVTAPPRATSSTITQTSYRPAPVLSSSAFRPGEELPEPFQCGSTAPPPLTWGSLPKGTVEVALAMFALKPSAEVHWLVVGIPASVSTYTGTDPPGAMALANSFGTNGWSGPCVPEGETQSFEFEVLALPAPAHISPGQTPTGVLQELETQAADGRGYLPVTVHPGAAAGTGTGGTALTGGSVLSGGTAVTGGAG